MKLHPQAVAAIGRLAPHPKKRIRQALQALAEDPADSRLDLKRLDHDLPYYRCRVGDYRIVFRVDSEVFVHRIFHRRDGYGWLERL